MHSLFLAAVTASAQLPQHHDVSSSPPYTPHQQVSGVIRVYGNNYIPALMKRWEEGFQKFQPNVTFTTNLPGTEAAMAGITTGIADISFIGREGYRSEINGFKGRWGYLPLGIEISSGSFGTPHKTFSLEVFVNKDNPLPGLTMEQAQEVFGNNPTIKTWGDLGVTGPMASHPIHIYGYQFDTGMAGYFNRVILHDKGTWNPSIKDFDNGHDSKGEVINAGVYISRHSQTTPTASPSPTSSTPTTKSAPSASPTITATATASIMASTRTTLMAKPNTSSKPPRRPSGTTPTHPPLHHPLHQPQTRHPRRPQSARVRYLHSQPRRHEGRRRRRRLHANQ